MCRVLIAVLLCISISSPASAVGHNAEGCVVIEAESRKLLYGDNENKKLPMASTTKIMTAVVALENADIGMEITVSEKAQNQEGSRIYLCAGNKITLENLLYGLMLNSGNDAAMAIAEGVGGDEEGFVIMMNEKAEELGCKNTQFKNPSGLPEEGHYSTAYDMSLIMAYAMEIDIFKKITGTKEYQIKLPQSTTYLRNHNKLLWQYKGCIGGKTGFTKAAGRCLVSCAEKNGVRVIAVTLADPNDWQDHRNLFDKAFENTEREKIISKNDIICTRKINGARVNILSGDDSFASLHRGRKKGLVCRIQLLENIESIDFGTKLGYAKIFINDYEIGQIDIISGTYVQKRDTFAMELKHVFEDTLLR